MIVERPSGSAIPVAKFGLGWHAHAGPWRSVALFLLLFVLVVTLQVAAGGYHSEFAGYPDEPAHYVTGLMVRDYLASLHYATPMKFAENYYAHYPKVAFGHWPPLLYVVEAGWMLIFSSSRISILLEMAILTTVLAFSVHSAVKRHYGWLAGALAGVFLVLLPEIQLYSVEIMAETLLVLVSFWGAIFFARFMERGRWQDSLWFGVFSSLAILTKGNGWEMALIPPLVLFLTRKWSLVRRPAFWLPALVVAVLCGPWQLQTMSLVQRGWTGGDQPNLPYTLHAMAEFLRIFPTFTGGALFCVILIGLAVKVIIPLFRTGVEAEWATMAALIFAAWFFHSVVPAGIESRKLIAAIPALILFLFAGGEWLVDRLRWPNTSRFWKSFAVASGALVIFGLRTFSIPREKHFGFTEAADFIDSRQEFRNSVILVSSERDGEGLLISEVAMREKRLTHRIVRATKALSQTDWNGATYKCLYTSPEQLMKYLASAKIGLVVLDTFPARTPYLHQEVIWNAIRNYPESWNLVWTYETDTGHGVSGRILVYRYMPHTSRY